MNCLSPIFIALFYIFFSALWIIFSDLLLAEIFKDPEKVLYFQTFKGLVFITVSGILIYILVKSNNVRLKRLRDKLLLAQEQKAAAKKKLLEAQKLEAIGTLSGGIAHDFNNILTGLYGQLELLKNNYGNPEIFFKYINNIIEITDRAKDLVTQILVFSRKKIIPKKPIHAVAVIEEAFNLLRSTLPQSIDIKKEYDSKN
ncbi:MAG: histidine kinase dimerization/phospho-acceptor domain-containing protein, partial [Bacteriovoracia bacterium]